MRINKRTLIILFVVCAVIFVAPVTTCLHLPTTAAAEAATVKLNRTSVKLLKKQTFKLKVSGTSKKVKWSTNNKSVAKVSSSGLVTPQKGGKAVITAKIGSKKLKCNVTVVGSTYTFRYTTPLNPYTKWWNFNMEINNPRSEKITVSKIMWYDLKDGRVVQGTDADIYEMLGQYTSIKAHDSLRMGVGYEYSKNMKINGTAIAFTFKTKDGLKIKYTYIFKMVKSMNIQDDPELKGPSVYKYDYTTELDKKLNEWHYNVIIENPLSQKITFKKATIHKTKNNKIIESINLNVKNLHLPATTLNSGASMHWHDAHPYDTSFDGMEYRFVCSAEDGSQITLSYFFNMTGAKEDAPVKDYSSDSGKDLDTLRHNANYKLKIANGVYWVPANALGTSRYTNAQIHGMVKNTPEEKQSKISTLYEAIQLYEIGNFREAQDNVRIEENGVNWEHHKPGYYSVISNCGCCASDSSWLSYILKGDYEDIGYIQISQRDGGGHVINYIKSGSWYYIIDLTHYRNDFMHTSVESGSMNDFYQTDIVLGNVLAVQDLKDYADYFVSTANDPPGLVIQEKMTDVPPIDGVRKNGNVTITYGNDQKSRLTVLYDDPDDKLFLGFAKAPSKKPNWASLCS